MKPRKEPLKPEDHPTYLKANKLRDLIFKRVGITKPSELKCPRERSDMTPCVARDGWLAVCEWHGHLDICVGCERRVEVLLDEEEAR